MSRQDKYGFYQVGDQRFYSKLEAVQLSVQNGKPVHWNFNDEVYSNLNWEIEPVESLEVLYAQRAQQLREKYDHLVLWFSGGADSTNILNSFIDNDIKLDEVASFVNYEATGDKYNFLNGEIYNVAAPVAEHAKEKQPWLKHTVIDLAQPIIDHFVISDSKFDWIYHMNTHLNPNNAIKHKIKLLNNDWRKMFETGKKVCFIFGVDKPRVACNRDTGEFYFKFADFVDNSVTANMQINDNPYEFDEFFYWTPDAPDIAIKQGHIIKRYVKSLLVTDEHLLPRKKAMNTMGGAVSVIMDDDFYVLEIQMLHRLVYPNYRPALFQAKAPSLLFTPRDDWFFNLPDSDPAKYAWKVGLEEAWKKVPDVMKVDPNKMSSGFKLMTSKPYNLGE